eukprot:TRINITY_DN30603_c0_g1_i1.p1 TRINITY_DN30603_c0_g1~~TRINITY_DN30603_c0_g1_i1.p1  ORF type:complete len:318 (+),score=96.97 TRINITY_DN30603_c0_g1_i1:80-955(+)
MDPQRRQVRRRARPRGLVSALLLVAFGSSALLGWLWLQSPARRPREAPAEPPPRRSPSAPPSAAAGTKAVVPPRTQTPGPSRALLIPPRAAGAPRYTIVFDMDETLLHSTPNARLRGPPTADYFMLEVGTFRATVAVRPHCREVLRWAAANSELVLWTAGTEDYARRALQLLGDDIPGLFAHFIARNDRWFHGVQHTKPLDLLGRDKATTVLIDNNEALMVPGDEHNAIVPSDYYRGTKDQELRTVQGLLQDLVSSGRTVPDFLAQAAAQGRLQWRNNRYWISSSGGRIVI